LHEEIVSRNLSLEEFVADLSCREADNDQTRRISGVEPKFGAVSRSDLAKAKANLLEHFSIVGVTERFDETVVLMKWILGWTVDPVYQPGLVNQDRPKASALAQHTIDIVLEHNQHDLELWEFARTLLLQRIATAGLAFQDELDRFRILNADYCAKFPRELLGIDDERSNAESLTRSGAS